nr:MAG TPA: hypothetical protein [Caudoviricetes sp.]
MTSFNEKFFPWKKNHSFSFNESIGGKEKQ